jgi:hypothetical protein
VDEITIHKPQEAPEIKFNDQISKLGQKIKQIQEEIQNENQESRSEFEKESDD